MSVRWQDESWDAPTQAPFGFALPPDGAIGDVVYHEPSIAATTAGPAPTGMAAPDGQAPSLDSLVPAPETPRDPTQPFFDATTADDTPAWDPHQPLLTGDSTESEDAWPADTDDEGHPNFPAPTGRPAAPAAAWHSPGYPPPAGQPGTTLGTARPGVAQIARPAAGPSAGDPYQTMRQPYAQARPWQTAAGGPPPVYRPAPPKPQTAGLDWIMLGILAVGIFVPMLSWILFVVAFMVALGRHTVRPITLKVYYVATAVIIVTWLLDLVSTAVMDSPLFYTYYPPYDGVARICCAVAIVVAVVEFLVERNRRR